MSQTNVNQTPDSTPAPNLFRPQLSCLGKQPSSPYSLTPETGLYTWLHPISHSGLTHQPPFRSLISTLSSLQPVHTISTPNNLCKNVSLGPICFPHETPHFLILPLFACYIGFKLQERRGHAWYFPPEYPHNAFTYCWAYPRNQYIICWRQLKNESHLLSWGSLGLTWLLTNSFLRTSPLASLNIWSSSCRRLCSTWRRPLSSASRIRRCRSASMARAWTRLSSCSLTSSLDRKSNMSASTLPSSPAKWFSTRDTLKIIIWLWGYRFH